MFQSVAWPPLGEGPWRLPVLARAHDVPDRCDAAIVGAGVTGLSCALTLAQAGIEVVVLDRSFGEGAACRSGGIIVGDTLVGPAPGFEGCELALRDWVRAHDVACHLEWTGCDELERDPAAEATSSSLARQATHGSSIGWFDSGRMRVSSTIEGGMLDPAALVGAIAQMALAGGARICDGVFVQDISRHGRGVRLTTNARSLVADRVLVATDATMRSTNHDRWPQRRLTVALETEPVGDDLARAIGWSARRPFYTNDLPLLWGRPMESGGMLLGRELIDWHVGTADDDVRGEIRAAGIRLTERLRRLHPALSNLGVRRVWAGPIARDESGVPTIQPDPAIDGVFWAGGYGGHGLAQAFRLGTDAARLLMTRA